MINKNDLNDYFVSGIKHKKNLKIGVEHEKFILDKDTLLPRNYDEINGIRDILEKLSTIGWVPVYDDNQKTIVALTKDRESITLEPGGQIELSGAPLDNIHETCEETTNHLRELKKLGEEFNFILLGMGVEPNLTLEDFPWMPKQRYKIMKEYMKRSGTLGQHMMKRTCTNQVNIDFFSEEDMINKLRLMLNLEAIATAFFPTLLLIKVQFPSIKVYDLISGIIPTLIEQACFHLFLIKTLTLKRYTDYALNVPMYFIKRDNKYIDMTKYTFKEFFEGKCINTNHEVTLKDWEDHLTTLFPQARLKQYIEIRSMDACNWDLICSQPAFWVGMLYVDEILDKVNEITEGWSNEDRYYLNQRVPEDGLQTKFKQKKIIDFAQEFYELSKKGLEKRNRLSKNGEFNESIHMKELENNLEIGCSPADCLINKFNNHWGQSIKPIYQDLIF
jgi:glutamate--cysteine ligase